MEEVTIGLESFIDQPPPRLGSMRLGLLMNHASVDRHLNLACDVLSGALPDQLAAIFSPQHGLWGDAQANMVETGHGRHTGLRVPIHSLYSETRRPTPEMLAGIDALVIDLQDVGTRVYTFAWTVLECLRACASHGVAVIVFDRPNPIGGDVEGPLLADDYKSFVGGHSIPMRHGLTLGELSRLFVRERSIDVELQVVPLVGWTRPRRFDSLGRRWLFPSPNLPTFESTMVYPGQVLLEGTNLSEGRGTTTPFELAGAPYVDPESLCEGVDRLGLPGVRFLPTRFRPTFDKWADESCGGVSIHVTDANAFRPIRTSIALLQTVQALWPDDFGWIDPPYEYETTRPPIDIIYGDSALRESLARSSCEELAHVDRDAWLQRTEPIRLYES